MLVTSLPPHRLCVRLAPVGIANAFEVSLDYLVGDAENKIDKTTLNRIQQVDKMKPDDKNMIYAFLDAGILH